MGSERSSVLRYGKLAVVPAYCTCWLIPLQYSGISNVLHLSTPSILHALDMTLLSIGTMLTDFVRSKNKGNKQHYPVSSCPDSMREHVSSKNRQSPVHVLCESFRALGLRFSPPLGQSSACLLLIAGLSYHFDQATQSLSGTTGKLDMSTIPLF